MKQIWMAVTADEYELPIAIADSQKELAGMLNTTVSALSHKQNRHKKGRKTNRYAIVVVNREEESA